MALLKHAELCLVVIVATMVASASGTALDDYVRAPDPSFNYNYSGVTREGNGWTAYMYTVTSQTWMTEAESSRPVWTHQLALIVPEGVNTSLDSAVIYYTGGRNDNMDKFPEVTDEGMSAMGQVAFNTKSPTAVMWQIPNEPISFPCDPVFQPPKAHGGGGLIALSFWHFMNVNSSDPNFIAYFAMVKAGVRGLDVLSAIVPRHVPGAQSPTKFFVSGASKRGWTAWLVGCVDDRVKGLIPIVLSAVHVHAFAKRQWHFYGAWTFAFGEMYLYNFTKDIDTENMHKMLELIDPWYYKERLTMPKLAINAVGDEFQMPDDQRYWAHDMPGEMNLCLVQNAEHSMITGVLELVESFSSFVSAVQADYARPNYTWAIDEESGNITVYTPVTPKSVTVYYADSPEGVSKGRRDFRWAALNTTPCPVTVFGGCFRPVLWSEDEPVEVAPNTYMAHYAPPEGRWLGFLMELRWENPTGPTDFVFTSPASIVPNTLPFPSCHGEDACRGELC